MKKIFLIIISLLVFILNYSFSYQVDLPTSTNDIKSENWWSVDSLSSQNYYQNLAWVINKYLWFFMWVVSLWMVLYAWFLLVSSNGKADAHKKANNILVWWLIGIFVSLLSYVIVKLLITLF